MNTDTGMPAKAEVKGLVVVKEGKPAIAKEGDRRKAIDSEQQRLEEFKQELKQAEMQKELI